MRKIETLFLRRHEVLLEPPNDEPPAPPAPAITARELQLVKPVVRPGCEWALFEGRPTEKFDGSACLVLNGRLFRRCELRPGNTLEGWIHWSFDPTQLSGHGWLPVGEGPDDRWHREAWQQTHYAMTDLQGGIGRVHNPELDGTYELVGPKVQKNPYGLMEHHLWKHGSKSAPGNDEFWDKFYSPSANQFELLKLLLGEFEIEGIVWHHPDGRMVKIKRRDFGIPWPVKHNRPKVSDAHLDAMLEGSEPK